jgi:hypothetical protein
MKKLTMKKLTKKLTKVEAAKKFFDAVDAINEAKNYKDVTIHLHLNAKLDEAMIDYKISHNITAPYGFFDCMNHYNTNYAN